jgi:hypothetical protein
MAQVSESEYRRTAYRCPKHDSTHIQRLVIPDPGDYFAAFYTCSLCARAEAERINTERRAGRYGDVDCREAQDNTPSLGPFTRQ